jgi:hypothetical protein
MLNALILSLLAIGFTGPTQFALADDTVKEKVEEVANDSKRATKKAVRDVKDKTCKMINGKMECAAKKVKNAVLDGADKVEDAMD